MIGKTNSSPEQKILSLNAACVVWLPLNGNTKNYGTSDLVFHCSDGYCSSVYPGFIYAGCYKNFVNTAGGLKSDKQILLGNNQSFFCWANFDSFMSTSSLGGAMGGQHRNESNIGMGLTVKYVSGSTAYLSVSTGTGTSRTFNTYCGSTLLHSGTWYHLGYTYDGTTIKLYVNGQLDGSHNVPNLSNPADYIFTHSWSLAGTSGDSITTNYHMLGCMNDVRIYNKTLRDSDVQTIYNYRPIQRIKTKKMRYLLFGLNGSTVNSGNHFCEIQVFDINGNNVARGKVPTNYSGVTWSNLSYITDGNTASGSYASASAGTTKIKLDLGQVYDVAYIIQRNYYDDHRMYHNETVESSIDGTNFEMLYNSNDLNTGNEYRGFSLGHAIVFE